MKTIYKTLLICGAVVVLFSSCRKEYDDDLVNPSTRKCKTYTQQFEAVWQGMDQGYVFWGRDTVDWDARYEQYRPVFEEFDSRPKNKPVTYGEYQAAYTGLFEGLLDHHLTGRFYSPKGSFEAWVSPGMNDYYHNTSSTYERTKQLAILKKKAVAGTFVGFDPTSYGTLEVPGTYFCLIPGSTTNDRDVIAYFRFTNFYLTQLHDLCTQTAFPSTVSAQAPLKKFYGVRYWEGINDKTGYANNDSVVGIIIDLRGNGGGSTADLEPFIGSLSQSPTLVGYTRVKDGFGRLDYSPWSESIVKTPAQHLLTEKPVVVLADVTSVSCAELATMLIKALPNGVFIGERTYGAIGGLYSGNSTSVYHDLFYNGCFGDYQYFEYGPDPYTDLFTFYVYTSTFHMVDRDHHDVEGVGVQPDIEVKYSADGLERGRDGQLNRAIQYIMVGH